MEVGGDRLNFLDVTVIRDNELIEFDWYHKPTFSGRYLNFWSQHAVSQKIGTIAGLVDRVILLSNPKFHFDNLCFVIKVLLENDYPLSFIFENINNRLKNIIMASNTKRVVSDNSVDVVQPSWFTVPFVRGITEKFNRLNSEHMRVSFYSVNKLREFIRVHKDPLPRDKKSKVVYKISCKSCDASYVGQTCRQLKSRITEHKNHIRWNTSARSVITEHRLQEGHDFDWDSVAILDEEPHYRKRLISEMIFIRRQTHGLNLQMDIEGLPKAYLPIIDKL
ncbi:hypothetical protein ALC57_00481 [Trachymyrmex cornetzi]|uniref:GIY-YIG domain-containing protein n=1 Tax=Trachymyrmex cornetzi TaxID=471704 RepID=A0A151JRM8_9HYME|nr:hypothetical protein ALC57_00481 [Trachymyrmex cornetzi]